MESLITFPVLFFSLAVFLATYFTRKIIEALLPSIRKDTPLTKAQKIWEEFLLPALPVLVGIALGVLVTSWPWPPGIVKPGARAIAGAVCGLLSTLAYRMLWSFVTKKYVIDPNTPVELPSMEMVKAKVKEAQAEAAAVPPPGT